MYWRLSEKDASDRQSAANHPTLLGPLLEDKRDSYQREFVLKEATTYIREVRKRKESADNALWMALPKSLASPGGGPPRLSPTLDDVATAVRWLKQQEDDRERGPIGGPRAGRGFKNRLGGLRTVLRGFKNGRP